jgi:hypothetical protein
MEFVSLSLNKNLIRIVGMGASDEYIWEKELAG